MASKEMLKCGICGKEYYACGTCTKIKTYTPWRMVCDTLPHYVIYLALAEYTKTGDKAKAKEELSKCDLSGLDGFDKDIKSAIKEIMAEDLKPVRIQVKSRVENKKAETVEKVAVEENPIPSPTPTVEVSPVEKKVVETKSDEKSDVLPVSEVEAVPVKRKRRNNSKRSRNRVVSTIIEDSNDENKNNE